MALNASKVANNYAKVLKSISGSKASVILKEIKRVNVILKKNSRLIQVLDDVSVSKKQQNIFLSSLLQDTSKITRNFFHMLADNRHIFLVDDVIQYFTNLIEKERGSLTAIVKTAIPLTTNQKYKIINIIKKKFGYSNLNKIEINNIIDTNITGGIIIKIDSKTIDYSIKKRLQNLNSRFKKTTEEEE